MSFARVGFDMEDQSPGRFRLFYPEFGPVDAVLGFALFYFLVGLATVVAVDSLANSAPTLVPEPLSTWAAYLLWVVLALVALGQLVVQVQSNPRTFATAAERRQFLETRRPTERQYRWWAVWVFVGGAVAYVTFSRFVPTFATVVRFFVDLFVGPVPTGPFRVVDAFLFVSFFVAYSVLTRGLDRLVIGSLRSLVADVYRSDD